MREPDSTIMKLKGVDSDLNEDITFLVTHGNKTRKLSLTRLKIHLAKNEPTEPDVIHLIPKSEKAMPNGVATLDEDGLVPLNQIPSILKTDNW